MAEKKEKLDKNGNPVKKMGLGKKILIGIGVFIAILIVANLSSGGDSESSTSTTKEPEKLYKIGESVDLDNLQITITDLKSKKRVGDEYFGESASEGATLVCIQYKYKNITKEPISS